MSITRGTASALLLLAAACAGNPAPDGFLPTPAEMVRDLYGGWIEVTVPLGKRDSAIAGELIAVRADTVWILPHSGRVTALATGIVKTGRLACYRSGAGAVGGYTALGIVSTLSNGYFLILTAPTWLITGVVASSNESRAPLRGVPPLGWADLAPYGRFPQGLPPGIDLAEIRPKPRTRKATAASNP